MTLCGVNIDEGRAHVIAEISCNHGGSLRRALELLSEAKEAGASLGKLQTYTPDELVALRGDGPAPSQWGAQGWTMRSLYAKAQTPARWIPTLFMHAADIGLPLFSSVFGLESLALLESCGCEAYKVARLDNQHAWLIDACRDTGKPVIVSTDDAPRRWSRDDLFLYCPAGYPTEAIRFEHDQFVSMCNCTVTTPPSPQYDGFSYHGTSIEPCVMAATLGAKLLEVHVQLDEEPSELEQNISLSISQVSELVQRVRDVERWRA